MPELPDITVIAENLHRRLHDLTVAEVIGHGRFATTTLSRQVSSALIKRKLLRVCREGKEAVFAFEGGVNLSVHLMLTGYFDLGPREVLPQGAILTIALDTGIVLHIGDPLCKLRLRLNPGNPRTPDALSSSFTLEYFHRKLAAYPTALIKSLLINQRIVRGIGNAYADEILWHARISPWSLCGKLDEPAVATLYTKVKTVLTEAIERIRQDRPDLIRGEYRDFLSVHLSDKTQTSSGAPILCGTVEGRATYHTSEQVLYGGLGGAAVDDDANVDVIGEGKAAAQRSGLGKRKKRKKQAATAGLPEGFHPLIAEWFGAYVGTPTDVQMKAWPQIAPGGNVLVTAPTGSGKTLTAFLWAINQLVTGAWETGITRVLYISPLKALNNDVRENLLQPLEEIGELFREKGVPFPEIHVLTRSGDTPSSDRRRMLRNPPEILITTPESLNLILTSGHAEKICYGLTTVILDEIHAVVGSKRGTYLMTAVERLVQVAGEFQRIALTATVRPLGEVAAFVGGLRQIGKGAHSNLEPRTVEVIESSYVKKYDLTVRFPKEALARESDQSLWEVLAPVLKKTVLRNRSTLIFTNNRALCEKLAFRINEGEHIPLAYAHHGSLSREIRHDVERKLRDGLLRAIVATHSLELGIDIGSLDEVILIQSPFTISSAVQRIGRAGHKVGETSTAELYPSHAHDFVEAAVLVERLARHEIEEVHPIMVPLDVLAQVIVSMVITEQWDLDDLYAQVKTAYPYRELRRDHFDLVLGMLAGKYGGTRIRDLNPRVSIDPESNSVVARKGARLVCMLSGGVIPDRGYYQLRHYKSHARIGELDEEFVWEARVGKTFSLGTQKWRIEKITHNDVLVSPAPAGEVAVPFWHGEQYGRDWYYSEHIAQFLHKIDGLLSSRELPAILEQDHCMDHLAAEKLISYCKSQRQITGCGLPHRYHLVIEHVATGPGGVPGHHMVVHTIWGGAINRPFALALQAAWHERFGSMLEIFPTNDSIAILVPEEISGAEMFGMVRPGEIERLLRLSLERSGYFGSRFRECASRALLLTRQSASRRMPLWMTRLRAQKLLGAVAQYEDFPILLETWRTCLQDEFDTGMLKSLLRDIDTGIIEVSEVHTGSPSPMARDITWNQINTYMYATDEPGGQMRSRLSEDLLSQVALTPGLRPVVPRHIVERFAEKRQRLYPDYSPSDSRDLVDWVDERVVVPKPEWQRLLEAMARDHDLTRQQVLTDAGSRLVTIRPTQGAEVLLAAKSRVAQLHFAFGYDPAAMALLDGTALPDQGVSPEKESESHTDAAQIGSRIEEWLRFYGVLSRNWCAAVWGIAKEKLDLVIDDLAGAKKIVVGRLVEDGTDEDICDAENFESLLRMARADAAPSPEPRPIEELQAFWAHFAGLGSVAEGPGELRHVLERLLCYPAPAHLWESEILPARMKGYRQSWLDTVLQEEHLRWLGIGERQVTFCFPEDLDLLVSENDGGVTKANAREENSSRDGEGESSDQAGGSEKVPGGPPPSGSNVNIDRFFPDESARYEFASLLSRSKLSSKELTAKLWEWTWETRLANDSFAALRKGIQTKFAALPQRQEPQAPQVGRRRFGRASFGRWKAGVPLTGSWYRIRLPELTGDILDRQERLKERVRILLDRYGILFREILLREVPSFQWSKLFRALRIMELAGEVVSGYFFEGIPGPQFASRSALSLFMHGNPESGIFWLNATDPVSVSGLGLDSLKGKVPNRVESTHCVYRGSTLVFTNHRNGKDLQFKVPPDDPDMGEILGPLRHMLQRQQNARTRIHVETINGLPAEESPYVEALKGHFDVLVEYKGVSVYERRWV